MPLRESSRLSFHHLQNRTPSNRRLRTLEQSATASLRVFSLAVDARCNNAAHNTRADRLPASIHHPTDSLNNVVQLLSAAQQRLPTPTTQQRETRANLQIRRRRFTPRDIGAKRPARTPALHHRSQLAAGPALFRSVRRFAR